jgi:allantoinase
LQLKNKSLKLKVIKSERVVFPDGIKKASVFVEDGIITDIVDYDENLSGLDVTDVGKHIVMPGIIDPHVHINEPGRTEWEGFETATRAAIAGGITTLVDMPLNSSPVTISISSFEEKLAATTGKLHTNVGFWGGIVPGNHSEIEGLIKRGVLGFKAFLTHSGIDEFPNATENDLRLAMPVIARYGLPLLVHCELTDNEKRGNGDVFSYQNYLAGRPEKWEDEAIEMMIRLSEEFKCRAHIVHLSSANSILQIADAKKRGVPITVETGQHYLFFNAEEIKDKQTQFKCAPPIREKANNDRLWAALKSGIIDFVATDHSPATPDLKEIESGDFMKAWGGIASLQFALPVLWTAARKRNCTFNDIVKWLCENPAKLMGKEKTKGKIAKGFEADLIVVDDDKSFIIDESMIHHKHKVTPYMNKEFFGVVMQTYLGGTRVFDNGIFSEPGAGKVILNNKQQV